ncbi:hypothetical protein [Stigmatella erecta]|uniref:Uncharacterized protein n=1 Tax=Stigmatella erecta TaxID=83460 RepID=A0A1I0LHH4_9BACT|nr:hypothetical protein [Stigmatella erecta]SEU39020.1 hypothetical protein SAMN05443639_1319 [Stigmatella erecta]
MKDWRPKLAAIDDPIADDYWSYETRDGTRRTSRVTIGRPAPLADKRDWFCPILFEHVTEGIYYSYGVGPVDALMNAMYFVRRRFYALKEVQPRAKPTAGSKRRKESKRNEAARSKTKKRAAAPKGTG